MRASGSGLEITPDKKRHDGGQNHNYYPFPDPEIVVHFLNFAEHNLNVCRQPIKCLDVGQSNTIICLNKARAAGRFVPVNPVLQIKIENYEVTAVNGEFTDAHNGIGHDHSHPVTAKLITSPVLSTECRRGF